MQKWVGTPQRLRQQRTRHPQSQRLSQKGVVQERLLLQEEFSLQRQNELPQRACRLQWTASSSHFGPAATDDGASSCFGASNSKHQLDSEAVVNALLFSTDSSPAKAWSFGKAGAALSKDPGESSDFGGAASRCASGDSGAPAREARAEFAQALLAPSTAVTSLVSQLAGASQDPMTDLQLTGISGSKAPAGRARLQAELVSHRGAFSMRL